MVIFKNKNKKTFNYVIAIWKITDNLNINIVVTSSNARSVVFTKS